ncbi:cationic amino acid transporter 7, chloroplastic-like [Salvia splendens]|uniref:cationic amino acid transporter 7, chloroplastic-like n=1 Tax=Salvia splendens TaxID=180675 RepID=UPI001C275DFF|nr:cationic amino acid transporter 7, chloroplastic-like [Salvia splendens]
MASSSQSFSSFKSYLHALSDTPNRLRRRACSVSTSLQEMNKVRSLSGSEMKRSLGWHDLICFGIGGMVGAGVFITTGRASRLCAGPAVVLSYAIAGLCALLSAFCYTEFAVAMPVAGGSFSYIHVTFGELPAFFTGSNLIVDYVLSNAAVARGLTSYLGTALGLPASTQLRFTVHSLPKGYNEIDLIAVVVVLLITIVICYSTKQSSWVNMSLTALHILFIAFVIAMGFWRGKLINFTEPSDPKNAGGFFPFGASGVFDGAAVVYMSYIGYDAVSTMAEEVENPAKNIPIGVTGSVMMVTVLYCLMAASMSSLLPYDLIDAEAPFSGAFKEGAEWVSNVIGVGASFGIVTSLLVAMLGQARYMCVIGRSCVVPSWFAQVHRSTSTPVNASCFLGMLTAAIAVFTDLDILLDLVSIGTLFVFYMVANAVIYRRYVGIGTTNPWPTLSFLFCFSLTCILFTLLWYLTPSGKPRLVMLGVSAALAIALLQLFLFMVPQVRKPENWGVPFMPWIPSISIFLNIFLLGALNKESYLRFGYFSALTLLLYLLYSLHSSFDAAAGESIKGTEEVHIP